MEISIGNLIDQLSIINIRLWMLEDECRNIGNINPVDDSVKMEAIGRVKLKINKCNQIRNEYIQAIDKHFGKDTGQADLKKYGK